MSFKIRHPEFTALRSSEGSVQSGSPQPAGAGRAGQRNPPTGTRQRSRRTLPLILALLALLPLSACHQATEKPGTRQYPARGTIQQISADHHLATIQHDAIPGYMPAMTMDFSVHDDHLLDGLERGDQVSFTLTVNNDDAWITHVQRLGHTDLPAPAPVTSATPALQPGDLLPDAEFVAEDGRHVHLSDFRGNVVVFTFFFTRCPLPNFCPLMNRNLAATRQLLLNDPSAPKNWQFLSISFDPDFDTPSTLASYADFYRQHNADRWLFVAATPEALAHLAAPLGLIIMRSGESISHNLRTIVVDPHGRLARQFNDNLWTPDQLKQAILAAAAAKN